jgi:hypothetical protein
MGQSSSVYRWKSGVGQMNAITNRLHKSFKIKDNNLTGRNSKNWEFFIEIDFFCVSKLSIDLFLKLPVSRFLAINIEGKILIYLFKRETTLTKMNPGS